MNIRKRCMALLTALTLTIGIAGCAEEKDGEIPFTLQEVLESYADDTNLDDLMAIGDTIQLSTLEADRVEADLMKSVATLEEYIAISNSLTALGIVPTESSTPETISQYQNITTDEVKLLIETLASSECTDIEKARVAAGLSYLADYYQDWIGENGLTISEELLKRVIKSAGCEASGLEIEYYDSCKIGSRNHNVESDYISEMEINDPVSGATLSYEIADDKGAISEVAEILYNIQGLEADESYETKLNYCKQALEATKVAIAAGVELEDNQITSEKTAKEAKQLILEMTAPSATTATE